LRPLRVLSRESPLAILQAEIVADLLGQQHPDLGIELVQRVSTGDQSTATIAEFGGKAAFALNLQEMLLACEADVVVHSAKDLQPTCLDGLMIGAVPEREDPADAIVGVPWGEVPEGAHFKTGSARRAALVQHFHPGAKIESLRGNIDTRLDQLKFCDAILMAMAAINRMNIGERRSLVVDRLDPDIFIPQVGQGTLAVECRIDDSRTRELLAPIDHTASRLALEAERAFLRAMDGDCSTPGGAYATVEDDGQILIRGILANGNDGEHVVTDTETAHPSADPGATLAFRLKDLLGADGGS